MISYDRPIGIDHGEELREMISYDRPIGMDHGEELRER